MKQELGNIVNTLYYLYFGNKELVYHFERIWTEDGMRYTDEEYAHIFCGMGNPVFPVNLETYYLLFDNEIIEETSGNKHERVFMLTEEYRTILSTILKKRRKERKTVAK